MELVEPADLKGIAEEGVSELGLEWPTADSIFELRIYRTVHHSNNAKPKQVTNTQEYLDFLHFHVFPLVEKLEKEANIEYWHVLNHGEYLDLRLLIVDKNQMKKVQSVLGQHSIAQNPPTKWGVYGDQNFGSRLGCQALLRLYYAQSKFVRDLVASIHWLKERPEEEAKILIDNILNNVPIYTSHMLLNVFPCDLYYEAIAHLHESEFRFHNMLNAGLLPQEAATAIHMILEAKEKLQRYIS